MGDEKLSKSEVMGMQNEQRLSAHEQICAERYAGINARLKRLEQILIGSGAFIISMLAAIVTKVH